MAGSQDGAESSANPTQRRRAYVFLGLMAGCFATCVVAGVVMGDTDFLWGALGPAIWTVLLWLYARKQ